MVRISAISILLFSLLVAVRLAGAQQDYIDQLIKLTELSDNQQCREAINGYKRLESQPAVPDWLRAGAEYEIAELYGELNETDNRIRSSGASSCRVTESGDPQPARSGHNLLGPDKAVFRVEVS